MVFSNQNNSLKWKWSLMVRINELIFWQRIHLSSSGRFDMKSCLLHRVTKLVKLQLGPIKLTMKVVQLAQQHQKPMRKNGNGYTPPLPSLSSFHLCRQQHKTEEKKKKNGKHEFITRFAPSSSLLFSPDPCHPTFPLLVPDWHISGWYLIHIIR